MQLSKQPLDAGLQQQLKEYVYPIIGIMHYVHKELGAGLPEYVYQEALYMKLTAEGYDAQKEYIHHPQFEGKPLNAFIKMDLVLRMPKGNVVIECKSISELTQKERYQTCGYLRGTNFPIAILVNFGTYPHAEIERYYYKETQVFAF